MVSKEIERELEYLKSVDQINEWSVTLGYGVAEYTIDLSPRNNVDVKILAKNLTKKYKATNFSRHVDGSSVAIKFLIDLSLTNKQ